MTDTTNHRCSVVLCNLIENSVDQFLAMYRLQPMEQHDELVPRVGVGRLALKRERLVKRILERIPPFDSSWPGSLYFRGVKGTGKTFLLHLIGEKLVREGHTVLCVNGVESNFWTHRPVVEFLRELNSRMAKSSERTSERRRAYVLIDETPSGQGAGGLTLFALLRETPYIVTIATGVPRQESRSASFEVKLGGSELLFQEEDMQECIDAFVAEFPAVPRDTVASTLLWSRDYTNGHSYPFLRLAEYCLREHLPECLSADFLSITKDTKLWTSHAMSLIRSRSFDNEAALKDAWHAVVTGSCSKQLRTFLLNSGYLLDSTHDSSQFLSILFMTLCMETDGSKEMTLALESLAPKDAVQTLLLEAFKTMNESHFFGSDSRPLLENAITYHLLSQLHRFKSVHVSFQVPLRTGQAGHPPTVDGFLNGRISHFVEIVRNGAGLMDHFSRFESDNGAYRKFRDEYVIVNIDTQNRRVPEELEPYDDARSPLLPKLYTFCVLSNRLFCGRDCIQESVSPFLRTPPPDEAFHVPAKKQKG